MPWISRLNPFIRGTLVFIFAYAAVGKILSPGLFVNDLLKSWYIDMSWVGILLWIIPGLELVAVTLLLIKRTVRLGLAVSLFLMVLFTIHLLLLWQLNPQSACSCGGLISALSPTAHLWMNAGLAGLCILPLISWPHTKC